MKQFREYVKEDYDYSRHPNVAKEIYDANDHVVDMVSLDTEMRKKVEIGGIPLLHDMQALNAINGLYLGTLHASKYPEHAKSVEDYKKFLSTRVPHLMGQITPSTQKNWKP